MKILGLVGMPKSGKGEASKFLQKDGWTHISMSGVLRDLIITHTGKKADELTRADMFQGGSYFRKKYGLGFIAQKCIERMEMMPKNMQEKVIIDGIRHPGEIRFIEEYKASHDGVQTKFMGIVADRDPQRDYQIRLQRLLNDPNLRGEHFENADTFDWTNYIETDMPPYGLMVAKCLEIVDRAHNGAILVNGEHLSREGWYSKVRDAVHSNWNDEGGSASRKK